MRTRARGPVSAPPSSPPPSPVHRKRRTATASDVTQGPPAEQTEQAAPDESVVDDDRATVAVTPRKEVKRVRFSDPEVLTDAATAQSTGLTPCLRRTKLFTTPKTPRSVQLRPARSFSLPTLQTSLWPRGPSGSPAEERQYAALREVLDSRIKRRLKRSHLSEEFNAIESETRGETRASSEVARLRVESEEKTKRIGELALELELQRQLGIAVNAEEEERTSILEAELARLRADVENGHVEAQDADLPTPPFDQDGSTDNDTDWDDDLEMFLQSPLSNRFVSSPSSGRVINAGVETSDVACQAAISNDDHATEIKSFEEMVARLTRERNDAEAALEVLHKELRELWPTDDALDSEQRLASIHSTFRQTRLDLEYLLPGETPGGFENASLLSGIVHHLRCTIDIIREKTRAVSSLQQSEAALRCQFNATLARVSELEDAYKTATNEKEDQAVHMEQNEKLLDWYRAEVKNTSNELSQAKSQLEDGQSQLAVALKEKESHVTSIERLQKALESYRQEVSSLEGLVNQMETDKAAGNEEIGTLRAKLDYAQATSDQSTSMMQQMHSDIEAAAHQLGEAQGTRDLLVAEMSQLSQRCSYAEHLLQQHMEHEQKVEEARARHSCQVDYSASISQLESILAEYKQRHERLDEPMDMQIDQPSESAVPLAASSQSGAANTNADHNIAAAAQKSSALAEERIQQLERKNAELQAALQSARKLIEFDFAKMPEVFAAISKQYEQSRAVVNEFLEKTNATATPSAEAAATQPVAVMQPVAVGFASSSTGGEAPKVNDISADCIRSKKKKSVGTRKDSGIGFCDGEMEL